MEEYRLNQVSGWTAKLGTDHLADQFAKEVKTFLSSQGSYQVRLKEEVVDHLKAMNEMLGVTHTLYSTSLEMTAYLVSNPLSVQYIKGTRTMPDVDLLAVITSPKGTLSVPICDLRHLSQAELDEIKRKKDEEERINKLTNNIIMSVHSGQYTNTKTNEMVYNIFSNMTDLVTFYNTHSNEKAAPNTKASLLRVMEMCKIRETWTYNPTVFGYQRIMRLVFEDVKIKFSPDKTPSKMHKDLFGKVYKMGMYVVDVGIEQRTAERIGRLLDAKQAYLTVQVGTRYLVNGLLHPHIDKSALHDDLWWGDPCWGSYQDALNKACREMDVLALVTLLKDFLNSCSESGWYGSVNYWDQDEEYCTCGQQFIATEGDEAVECRSCAGRVIEVLDAQDGNPDDEEEEEEE